MKYMQGKMEVRNLFWGDDLKLFAGTEKEIERLMETMQMISKGIIDTKLEIEKCGLMILNKGKTCKCHEFRVNSAENKSTVGEKGYKYMVVIECD